MMSDDACFIVSKGRMIGNSKESKNLSYSVHKANKCFLKLVNVVVESLLTQKLDKIEILIIYIYRTDR